MNIYRLPQNIEISRQNYHCIVNIRNHAADIRENECVCRYQYWPDLEQNGSRVFRTNFAKFIALSCFRTVDPRYTRSFVLSRSKSHVPKLCKSFFSMLRLRLLDDSISEVSIVKCL